ncbi:MAG TPA: ABC transporter permease [Streptosporangiaceae bacterium]|nr:ABC transporter permease [Streptosporangiaceae bacterium]
MTAASMSLVPPGHYRFAQVTRMEWAKLRSVRSTAVILVILVAGMTGLPILVMSQYGPHWAGMSAADRASFDPTNQGFVGLALGQLAVGVLGVLSITSDYSTGMIRATLAAVPRRGRVLAAKAAVLGALLLAAGELLAFAAFLTGQAAVSAPAPHATLGQPGVLRAVLLAGAYLCLIGLTGLGLGAAIRHTAGALGALVGVVFVLPFLVIALPEPVRHAVTRFLPEAIAAQSLTAVKPVAYSLSPWAGFGMLCLYATAALGIGGWLVSQRDA